MAVKPTLDWPDATVTLAGTVTMALLLARAKATPPEGAAALKVTVQEALPAAEKADGVQLTTETCGGATVTVTVAVWETAFSVAVTVTDCAVAEEPAVAAKVAELEPEAIVTLAGTVRMGLVDCSEMAVAAVTALVNVTVQVALWFMPSVDGAHPNEESWGGAVNVKVAVAEDPLALAVSVAL